MATCYRHSSRETGVACSSCGNPICTDCMSPTPVGMRCPDCAGQKTKVHTARSMVVEPTVTYVLIAINVAVFFAQVLTEGGARVGDGRVYQEGALAGVLVQDGEWWRLVTSGFLHAGLFHLLANMLALYILGQMIEPALGRLRFALVYFVSLLSGSFGALLLSPDSLTVGASGAVFGLMGAALVEMRRRGIDPMQSGIGGLLLLNLGLTFLPGLNISIGGHLGGLAGGVLAALAITFGDRLRSTALAVAGCVAIAAVAVVGAIAAAAAPLA